MTLKKRILKLLKEPSTYAGLAGVLGGSAVLGLSEEGWMQIFGVVMAIAGTIAMLTLDTGDTED